jgi:hypothetical protein
VDGRFRRHGGELARRIQWLAAAASVKWLLRFI